MADVVLTEKPSEPQGPLEVVDHTRDSLTLSWGPSASDGGSPILQYVLERREGWKTTWTNPVKVKPEGQKLTAVVPNLKEGQDYYFRVYAENTVGASKAIETETSRKPRSPFSEFEIVCAVLMWKGKSWHKETENIWCSYIVMVGR
jgi:titin